MTEADRKNSFRPQQLRELDSLKWIFSSTIFRHSRDNLASDSAEKQSKIRSRASKCTNIENLELGNMTEALPHTVNSKRNYVY